MLTPAAPILGGQVAVERTKIQPCAYGKCFWQQHHQHHHMASVATVAAAHLPWWYRQERKHIESAMTEMESDPEVQVRGCVTQVVCAWCTCQLCICAHQVAGDYPAQRHCAERIAYSDAVGSCAYVQWYYCCAMLAGPAGIKFRMKSSVDSTRT